MFKHKKRLYSYWAWVPTDEQDRLSIWQVVPERAPLFSPGKDNINLKCIYEQRPTRKADIGQLFPYHTHSVKPPNWKPILKDDIPLLILDAEIP